MKVRAIPHLLQSQSASTRESHLKSRQFHCRSHFARTIALGPDRYPSTPTFFAPVQVHASQLTANLPEVPIGHTNTCPTAFRIHLTSIGLPPTPRPTNKGNNKYTLLNSVESFASPLRTGMPDANLLSYLHYYIAIAPCWGRIFCLIVVGAEDQVAG